MLHVTPGLKGVYSSKFQDHENQDLQCPRAEEDEYSGELKTENPPSSGFVLFGSLTS